MEQLQKKWLSYFQNVSIWAHCVMGSFNGWLLISKHSYWPPPSMIERITCHYMKNAHIFFLLILKLAIAENMLSQRQHSHSSDSLIFIPYNLKKKCSGEIKQQAQNITGTPLAMSMFRFVIVVSWWSKSAEASNNSVAVSLMNSAAVIPRLGFSPGE